MEYNTARTELKIQEYGRNVQKMIEYIKTLPDIEDRTKAAQSVISIMVALNPQLKEQTEYKQKLWDHLFLISGYDLDVNAPYPMPSPAERYKQPKKPSYSSNHIKYRYYGKNVEIMIKAAIEMEESEEKKAFVNALASYMKMAYRLWNEEKVPDEVILKHLSELSKGKLHLDEINDLNTTLGGGDHGQSIQKKRRPLQNKPGINPRHNKPQGRKNFRRN